jgi:phosphatidylserine decarboxylase
MLHSIRSVLVPIRREGFPFIIAFAIATLLLFWLWQPLGWIGVILTGWCLYFFRDPARVTLLDSAVAVSPADGRIAAIGIVQPPRELMLGERDRRRVSVFMNVFDCHVNRAPVAGRVARVVYTPGKFFNAALDKASEFNERNALVIEGRAGAIGIVQIAGLVARRIVCFTEPGRDAAQGERIGMIRFGSRVDLYLPLTAEVLVSVGQTAVAGETVIARFGPEARERMVRID